MFSEIDQMLRASVSILVVAFGLLAVPATAFAHAVYDGDWSVLILTRGGACEPSVRYGVVIAEGLVINSGGIATVQGRITPSGTVSESCGPATNGQTAPAALAGIAAVALGGANARAASAMALGWRNHSDKWLPNDATVVALRADHVLRSSDTMRLLLTLNPLEEAANGGAGGTERDGQVADRICAAIDCAAAHSPESRHTKLTRLGRSPRVLNHKHTSRTLFEG